jgi:hypothetical protein
MTSGSDRMQSDWDRMYTDHSFTQVAHNLLSYSFYLSLTKGLYPILKVNNNGTVHLKVGAVTDTYNVRRLTPYTEPKPFNHGGKCNMQIARSRRTSEPASELLIPDCWD